MEPINQNLYIFFLVNLSFYWPKSRMRKKNNNKNKNIFKKKKTRRIRIKRMYTYDMHAHQSNDSICHLMYARGALFECCLFRTIQKQMPFLRWNECTFTNSRQLVSTLFLQILFKQLLSIYSVQSTQTISRRRHQIGISVLDACAYLNLLCVSFYLKECFKRQIKQR